MNPWQASKLEKMKNVSLTPNQVIHKVQLMPRPLRIKFPNAVYHVTSRGLERRAIVLDDRDRRRWLNLLGQIAQRFHWQVYSWALLNNHYHLFLRTPQGELSAGMHDLNSGYASAFNQRRKRAGPLLQGRYHAVLVEQAAHDWELSRYVHLNPVRAGLTDDPVNYAWSSCRHYFHSSVAPEWLAWREILSRHGRTLESARQRYWRYLQDGMTGESNSPMDRVKASMFLGSPSFIERMGEKLKELYPAGGLHEVHRLQPRPSMQDVERTICAEYRVAPEWIRRRSGHGNEARWMAICLARELTRLSTRDIGGHFGGIKPSAVSNIIRKVKASSTLSNRLAALLELAE